jgi:hypothetical protein
VCVDVSPCVEDTCTLTYTRTLSITHSLSHTHQLVTRLQVHGISKKEVTEICKEVDAKMGNLKLR